MPVAADVSLAVRRCLAVERSGGRGDGAAGRGARVRRAARFRRGVRRSRRHLQRRRGGLRGRAQGVHRGPRPTSSSCGARSQVADLAPALQEKFVFPSPSLRLVMAVSPEAQTLQHLFVFVGPRALPRAGEAGRAGRLRDGGAGEPALHDARAAPPSAVALPSRSPGTPIGYGRIDRARGGATRDRRAGEEGGGALSAPARRRARRRRASGRRWSATGPSSSRWWRWAC